MSTTSELLPLPDTPVTQMKRASGKWTSMFLRLLCRAPRTLSQALPAGRAWAAFAACAAALAAALRRPAPVGLIVGLRVATLDARLHDQLLQVCDNPQFPSPVPEVRPIQRASP